MQHITVSTAKKDFSSIFENATRYNESITIVSDDSQAAVLLNMEEWNGIQETLCLLSIPGMVKTIKDAANEPPEDGIEASEIIFDV